MLVQALTCRKSAAKALNMVSIDIREPIRIPLPAIAAALLASPNLTHLAVSLLPFEPSPLLYACSPALRELTLTASVPTAALTEFLMMHPNLVSLSLPNQSTDSVVELPPDCIPALASITAPPALVACLVPERPVTHVIISRPVPRPFMADVVESLAASSGPVTSLGIESDQVSLGVMQEITVRLRHLRSLYVKGRYIFRYSLTYSVSSLFAVHAEINVMFRACFWTWLRCLVVAPPSLQSPSLAGQPSVLSLRSYSHHQPPTVRLHIFPSPRLPRLQALRPLRLRLR